MTKRTRKTAGTLVILLLAVLSTLLTGCDMTEAEVEEVLEIVEDVLEELTEPTSEAPAPPKPGGIQQPDTGASGEGETWAVFFTNPVIPFDDVTSGGIEENLIALIEDAEYSIDAAMFEFDLQNVAEALIAAHRRGVRVRVVYDNEYTEDDPQIEELIDAGIEATPDDRSALMHNKFYIFDQAVVWSGSMNFTENGVYRNNNNAVIIVSAELAANYTTEFEEMFTGEFGARSPANTPYPGVAVGDMWVETYFSPEDLVMDQLLSLVSEAQESVYFMAFSYTDYDLAAVMMERADAGVDVMGVFESRGANTEYSECPTLLDYNLDVRLDGNPRTLHHKVIIIDHAIVATGSFNYSTNATESNDENLLIIHNPEIAALYEAEFFRVQNQARMPVGGECLAGED